MATTPPIPALTDEQHRIVHSKARTLKVRAGAGTGKTFTLTAYAVARPSAKMLYLAFNRGVRDEATRKFPKNVRCVTNHGLCYAQFGLPYERTKKLGNPKPFQISKALGIQIRDAGLVLQTIKNFLASASREILPEHVGSELNATAKRSYAELARKAWEVMRSTTDKRISMPHDGYLKLFQLSDPILNVDVILLDEAQDTNPVMLSIINAQTCGKVFVGDARQGIYAFRGAVNAMEMIKAEEELPLTQSWRYGAGIATIANTVLAAHSPHKHPLQGKGRHETQFAVDPSQPHTVLARTNATLFHEAVKAVRANRKLMFVGGIENYQFDAIMDTYNLQSGNRGAVQDKTIASFHSFGEMLSYAKELDDKEMMSLVRTVSEYGDSVPKLINRIKRATITPEKATGEEIVLTTAHKAKGLEWMDVILTDDFVNMAGETNPKTHLVEPPPEEEVNLLYVAMTRAIRGISLPESLMGWLETHDQKLYTAISQNSQAALKDSATSKGPSLTNVLIHTASDQEEFLKSFGINLDPYDQKAKAFPARVSESIITGLKEFGADFRVERRIDDEELADEQEYTPPTAHRATHSPTRPAPAWTANSKQAPLRTSASKASAPIKKETSTPVFGSAKQMFDSYGNKHRITVNNKTELVTESTIGYTVWHIASGKCLRAGEEALKLSAEQPKTPIARNSDNSPSPAVTAVSTTKSLIDNTGVRQHMLASNATQVLTFSEIGYAVWCLKTGCCLKPGFENKSLRNEAPQAVAESPSP